MSAYIILVDEDGDYMRSVGPFPGRAEAEQFAIEHDGAFPVHESGAAEHIIFDPDDPQMCFDPANFLRVFASKEEDDE